MQSSDDKRRASGNRDRVDEALERSLEHARNALAEALMAARALLDAVSIYLSGEAIGQKQQPSSPLSDWAHRIETLARSVGGSSPPDDSGTFAAFAKALDHEITRWENRPSKDREARLVLRAFLGVREIIGEFDLRADAASSGSDPRPRTAKTARTTAADPQPLRVVQRVKTKGGPA